MLVRHYEPKRLEMRLLAIWMQTALLVASLLAPLLLFVGNTSAAQLTSRKVAITTSKASATGVSYAYTFTTPTSGAIQSLSFQACTTPLGTCTAPTGMNINLGTATLGTGWTNATAFTRNAAASATNCTSANNMSCYSRTQVASETTGARVITLDTQTNSSVAGSYYIRVGTYSDAAWVTAVDSGNVALSITNQLTVNARVQEILNFCVGTTTVNDATTSPGADCTAITGTTVDIGVLDTGSVNISPVSTNGGSSTNGVAMVRTNAQSGAVITYYAEQDTASGKLKVTGASCSGTSTTDQCINDSATQTAFSAGTEDFGMTIAGVNCGSTSSYTCTFASGLTNLAPQSGYIGGTYTQGSTGTYGTGTGFAWQDNGTAVTIASSASSPTKVIDDEALILRFAATPAITTPTGAYTVTSTYVATATY